MSFIQNYKIQPRQKTQICQHSFEGNFKSVPTIHYLLKWYEVDSIYNIFILGFHKHIPIPQIPSIGFIMKFVTDKHRICQIDRFAQFSCKITNNQNSIFFYEISYTQPRHMIDYPRENLFLISIFSKNRISMKVHCSRRSDRAIKFPATTTSNPTCMSIKIHFR